jgi:hypothetical protein
VPVSDHGRHARLRQHGLVLCPGAGVHVHGVRGGRRDRQSGRGPLHVRRGGTAGRWHRESGCLQEEEALDRLGRTHEEPGKAHPCATATRKGRLQFLHLRDRRRGLLLPIHATKCIRQPSLAVRTSSARLSVVAAPGVQLPEFNSIVVPDGQGPLAPVFLVESILLELGRGHAGPWRAAGGLPPWIRDIPTIAGTYSQPATHQDVHSAAATEPGYNTTWRARRAAVQRICIVPAQSEARAARRP